MKKVALYSSSNPSRKARVAESEAPPVAAPAPPPQGALRRLWQRHERPLLVVAGALFAAGLVLTYAKSRPAAHELTQKDIDAAVLHTLENHPLPAMAAKAFAAIEPSVVRVMGIGPDTGDDEDDAGPDADSGKGKGADKGRATRARGDR